MMPGMDVYQALSEKLGAKNSKWIPQIWKMLVTPEEGRVLLDAPFTEEELARKMNLTPEQAKEKAERFVILGVVIPIARGGPVNYFLPRGVGNFYESASHHAFKIVGKELLELWRKWQDTEFWQNKQEVELRPVKGSRVFPWRGAVKDDGGLLPHEDLRSIINGARRIAVVDCPCRLIMHKCNHIVENCFLFDKGADLAIRRGSGKELTPEQAYALMQASVEDGLIPQGANRKKTTNVCFCCNDCCIIFLPQLGYNYHLCTKSRYECLVDHAACTGCQICVERCPFDAIAMVKVAGSKKLKAKVEAEKCYGCGVCVAGCPDNAMDLKLVRPQMEIPDTLALAAE